MKSVRQAASPSSLHPIITFFFVPFVLLYYYPENPVFFAQDSRAQWTKWTKWTQWTKWTCGTPPSAAASPKAASPKPQAPSPMPSLVAALAALCPSYLCGLLPSNVAAWRLAPWPRARARFASSLISAWPGPAPASPCACGSGCSPGSPGRCSSGSRAPGPTACGKT